MPKRSTILASAALGLSLAGAGLAAAPAALAHTPAASATCSEMTVTLNSYTTSTGDLTPNTVTVSIDGKKESPVHFGQTFSQTYTFADKTVSHSYVVDVDAVGTAYDKTFNGSSTPCPAPAPAKDAAADVAVTPATCDAPGRLVLGEAVNAVWGAATATAGPAQYSVTATAKNGHVFADGKATKVFTGPLEGTLDKSTAPCVVVVPVPEKPKPTTTVRSSESVDCTKAEIQVTTTTTTTGHVLNEAGTGWVAATPVVTTATSTKPAKDQACPAATGTDTPTVVTPTPTAAVTPVVTPTPAASVQPAAAVQPAASVTTAASSAPELAETGTSAAPVALLGGLLLLTGLAFVLRARTRKA